MYISEIIEISNYRNLTGKTIKFSEKLNFIIGENNIGKTNILELIYKFFSVGKFEESDFSDLTQPIQIKLKIKYSKEEIGFFENDFDLVEDDSYVEDNYIITLIGIQTGVDDRIDYYHDSPARSHISMSTIKKINVLYYYAQRMPSKEIDFRKKNGSGKVLNYLIQHSLSKFEIQEKDILNITSLNNVKEDINKKIKSLASVTGDDIHAYMDSSMGNIICRLIQLGDKDGRDLNRLGDGIQYAFNILLQILDTIDSARIKRKQEDFEDRLINKNNKKYFPLFLILDEPEIHQHPYRQRNLIKKIGELMNNENSDFLSLLKELFGIDGLIGQIFIATHSPNILLNDHKQFIRVYKNIKNNNQLEVISGMNTVNDENLYKHMFHSYTYLKEAMFSRYVIFVEGDSEYGAFSVFAKRMKFDMDEKGIGVIKLEGANNVLRYMELYNEFGIKSVAILDKDQEEKYGSKPGVFFTTGKDFEEDIYENFKLRDYLAYCEEWGDIDHFIKILKKKVKNFDPVQFKKDPLSLKLEDSIGEEIMIENKENELEKLKKKKNVAVGAHLAEYVTRIPSAYESVFNELKKEDLL